MRNKLVKMSAIAVLAFIVVFAFTSNVAVTGDTNMILEAGKTYLFTNTDKQNACYITNNVGSGFVMQEYDYVYRDDNGIVTSYGSSAGRMSVSAGGSSIVTISEGGDLNILYPSDNISVKEASSEALTRETIAAGKTIEISNKNRELSHSITMDAVLKTVTPKYDIVVRDMSGAVSRYQSNESLSSMTVPEGGSLLVTAAADDLRITMPNEWRKSLSMRTVGHSALYVHTLAAGGTIRIANNSDVLFDLSINGAVNASPPKYDYIFKDISGKVLSYDTARIFKNLPVEIGGTTIITASQTQELNVWFPYEWRQNGLTVTTQTSPALYFHTLKSGKTIEINNSDKQNTFQILNNSSSLSTTPKYDYVYRDMNGKSVKYGTEDLYESFSVDYGGSTLITAKKGYDLKLWLPYEWTDKLTFNDKADQALYICELPADQTLLVKSSDTDTTYTIAANSYDQEHSPQLDYVYTDISGHVSEYGSGKLFNGFSVQAGGSTKITANNGYLTKVWMPYEWTSVLSVSQSDKPALHSYIINPGQSMSFVNSDTDMVYNITSNCDDTANSSRYDYVYKDATNSVRTYGSDSRQNVFTVDKGGYTIITADDSYRMKVWLPTEWLDNAITANEYASKALHYYTLGPSKSARFKNLDKKTDYSLSTNSTREVNSASYDYVLRDSDFITSYGSNDLFETIEIERSGEAAITAANSYPLKIWFPGEWLDKSISITEESKPVLYTYSLEPDKTVEISNHNSVSTFRIFTNSGEDNRGPKLDYVTKDSYDRVTDCVTSDYHKQFPVENGGSTVVTAGRNYSLELWFPNDWIENSVVTLEEVSHPAVYYTTVRPGQGLRVVNNNQSASYQLYTDADGSPSSAKYEYLFKDKAKKIISCGSDVSSGRIAVEIGGVSQITVTNGADMKVWLPYEWTVEALALSEGSYRTLYNYTLPAGQTVDLVNLDKDNAFTVFTNSTGAQGAPEFDYVYHNTDRDIVGYGHADTYNSFNLLSGGRTTITAGKNFDLEIWYPAEWNNETIEINDVAGSALYYYTLGKDRSVEIVSITDNKYGIQNDSGFSLVSPKYDYQIKTSGGQQEIEKNRDGDIIIPPRGTVELRAVNSELKLWMPEEWEKYFYFR